MSPAIPAHSEAVDWSMYGGAESFEGQPRLRRTVKPNGDNKATLATPPKDPSDFLWIMTEEPHRSRRMTILKAHPEVTKLMGYEPLTKWVVLFVVSVQLGTAYLLRNTHPLSPVFLLAAYVIGATANHNLFLAVHEITHNLAFQGVKQNKLFAMFANLPISIPYSMTFKRYHLEHHKQLGEEGVDTDLPTRFEAICLNSVAGKAFFATFQILFYALRPGLVRAQKLTPWHFLNIAVQVAFDVIIGQTWGSSAIIYFLMSSFLAGSLHPCAGHFIAEHFVWDGTDQETYSYYGLLNILAYNVGYHNEHHDFPSIPWTRLPKLRALAPEVYDALPSHPSWPMVTFNFIFDHDINLFSRVKRLSKEAQAASASSSSPALNKGKNSNGDSAIDAADDDALTARGYADSDAAVKTFKE